MPIALRAMFKHGLRQRKDAYTEITPMGKNFLNDGDNSYNYESLKNGIRRLLPSISETDLYLVLYGMINIDLADSEQEIMSIRFREDMKNQPVWKNLLEIIRVEDARERQNKAGSV